MCTFASTQQRFVEQPWYGCYTCDMVTKRGVCHLCASACHAGHQLIYNTTSEFFCDCAAEFGGHEGRCCSVARKVYKPQQLSLFSSFLPWTNCELFDCHTVLLVVMPAYNTHLYPLSGVLSLLCISCLIVHSAIIK